MQSLFSLVQNIPLRSKNSSRLSDKKSQGVYEGEHEATEFTQ